MGNQVLIFFNFIKAQLNTIFIKISTAKEFFIKNSLSKIENSLEQNDEPFEDSKILLNEFSIFDELWEKNFESIFMLILDEFEITNETEISDLTLDIYDFILKEKYSEVYNQYINCQNDHNFYQNLHNFLIKIENSQYFLNFDYAKYCVLDEKSSDSILNFEVKLPSKKYLHQYFSDKSQVNEKLQILNNSNLSKKDLNEKLKLNLRDTVEGRFNWRSWSNDEINFEIFKKNYESDTDSNHLSGNNMAVNVIEGTNYLGLLQNFQLWFLQNKKYKSGLACKNFEEIWQFCLTNKNFERSLGDDDALLWEYCCSEDGMTFFPDLTLTHWWYLLIYDVLNGSSDDENILLMTNIFDNKFKYLDINLLLLSLKKIN